MYPFGLRWHYLWSPLEAVRFISNFDFDKDMIMFAVIKTGGKQYKGQKDTKLIVEKIDANVGDEILLNEVLIVGEGENVNFFHIPKFCKPRFFFDSIIIY